MSSSNKRPNLEVGQNEVDEPSSKRLLETQEDNKNTLLGLAAELASDAATIANMFSYETQYLDSLNKCMDSIKSTTGRLQKLVDEANVKHRSDTIDETSIVERRKRIAEEKAKINASDVVRDELVKKAVDKDLYKGSFMENQSLIDIIKSITSTIDSKRELINFSNKREFLRPKYNDTSCARSDAILLNRSLQMKHHQVEDKDLYLKQHQEQLSKSTKVEENDKENLTKKEIHISKGVDERLNNIEKHLNVHIASGVPLSVFERVKVLEDRLMQLEDEYPAWSAFFFNQQTADKNDPNLFRMPTESLGYPPQTVVYREADGKMKVDTIPDPRVVSTKLTESDAIQPRTDVPQFASADNESSVDVNDTNSTTYSSYEEMELRIQQLKQSLLAKVNSS